VVVVRTVTQPMAPSMAALSIAAPPIAAASMATTLGLGIVIYVVEAVTDIQEQAEDSRSGRFPATHL
jgi:type III secretory pathway component EscS